MVLIYDQYFINHLIYFKRMENQLGQLVSKINKIKNEGEYPSKEDTLKMFDDLVFYMKEVQSQSLFSDNEDFEELQTESIKYMSIPYYQAELLLMIGEDRKKHINLAVLFYDEFFKLLSNYKFISKDELNIFKNLRAEIKEAENVGKENSNSYAPQNQPKPNKPNMEAMTRDREEKVKEYKAKKALIDSINQAEARKEENTRDYYVAYLRLNWKNMTESLRFLKTELESLAFISQMKDSGKYDSYMKKDVPQGKLEMLKINEDNLKDLNPNEKLLKGLQFGSHCGVQYSDLNQYVDQKLNYKEQIFRNPNPPTMTLDQFADTQIELMNLQKEQEEASKIRQQEEADLSDENEEVDDRRKQEKRAWDDWKDAHEKGAGNKKR